MFAYHASSSFGINPTPVGWFRICTSTIEESAPPPEQAAAGNLGAKMGVGRQGVEAQGEDLLRGGRDEWGHGTRRARGFALPPLEHVTAQTKWVAGGLMIVIQLIKH